MTRYDKMYHLLFNAITDARAIAERLPPSPELTQLKYLLDSAQEESEEIYLQGEDAKLIEISSGLTSNVSCLQGSFGVQCKK